MEPIKELYSNLLKTALQHNVSPVVFVALYALSIPIIYITLYILYRNLRIEKNIFTNKNLSPIIVLVLSYLAPYFYILFCGENLPTGLYFVIIGVSVATLLATYLKIKKKGRN